MGFGGYSREGNYGLVIEGRIPEGMRRELLFETTACTVCGGEGTCQYCNGSGIHLITKEACKCTTVQGHDPGFCLSCGGTGQVRCSGDREE